jgi:pimeloyl-ACP methyl ester carboxylesterase
MQDAFRRHSVIFSEQADFYRRALLVTAILILLLISASACAREEKDEVVKKLASQVLTLETDKGLAKFPIEVSANLTDVQPAITRAIVVIHGKGRNVDGYFEAIKKAAHEAGASATTLIIAPQFLNDVDIPAHRLDATFLRWKRGEWSAGEDADGPADISSFSVVDQLMMILTDKTRFPALKEVVLAGHSGGGQYVQRYAIVGHAIDKLTQNGIALRFIVANPSSYFYFDDERPNNDGVLTHYAQAASCKNFNHWRYGPIHAPSYVRQDLLVDLKKLYFSRPIIYLLGTADTDPNHPDLDKSCAGEAQGPNRLMRGKAFFAYVQHQQADPKLQQFWLVLGVGHDDRAMFDSTCGVAALFESGTCSTRLP